MDKNEEFDNDILAQYEKTIEDQKNQIEELKDKHLRALAEMDNLRKRSQKEREDISKYALEKAMTELLPVLDSFDKALEDSKNLENSAENFKSFLTGSELVKKQLETALERFGLKSFESKGQPFDPNKHQAVQKIESEGVTEDTVEDEYVKGYMLNDRLLRAAMVTVAVPSE